MEKFINVVSFVLHLMKHNENAKYLYEFRKLTKNTTTCILFYFYRDIRNKKCLSLSSL